MKHSWDENYEEKLQNKTREFCVKHNLRLELDLLTTSLGYLPRLVHINSQQFEFIKDFAQTFARGNFLSQDLHKFKFNIPAPHHFDLFQIVEVLFYRR